MYEASNKDAKKSSHKSFTINLNDLERTQKSKGSRRNHDRLNDKTPRFGFSSQTQEQSPSSRAKYESSAPTQKRKVWSPKTPNNFEQSD